MEQNISITILGSGVMVPTKERNPAGFLVEVADKKILLDCGHGVIRRLVDYGYNIQDIDIVFISHFHTDHFGDAFNLIHSRWVDDNYNQREHKKLIFICPKGIIKRFQWWRKIYWVEPREHYPVEFLEGARKWNSDRMTIETFAVSHVEWFQSLGVVIKYSGRKIVYTGDIGSCHDFEHLINICHQADLLITEASYEQPTPNHYTIGQVKELAKESRIKKVLIVHTRPQHIAMVEKFCRQNKQFILGKDGIKMNL